MVHLITWKGIVNRNCIIIFLCLSGTPIFLFGVEILFGDFSHQDVHAAEVSMVFKLLSVSFFSRPP